jgi:hypothetical protein
VSSSWYHEYVTTVKRQRDTGTCRLRGRVIESFEVDGVYLLRLTITGGDIEIPSRTLDAVHLGDALQVEGDILHAQLTVNPELLPPPLTHATRRRKSSQ